MKYKLVRSPEFLEWYERQNEKTKGVIDGRFDRILFDEHFGHIHQFDGIIELKWSSGIRIYTFIHEATIFVVLNGGNKNGQDKDIRKAKKIKERYIR